METFRKFVASLRPETLQTNMKTLSGLIQEVFQEKVEGRNYTIRKNVLEYDDVMNQQREIIYSQRREVIESDNVYDIVKKLYAGII